MIQSGRATYNCADSFIGNSFSVSDVSPRDVIGGQGWSGDGMEAIGVSSEVQRKAIYESTQADAFSHASIHVAPQMYEPLTDLLEVKNYNSFIEIAGLQYAAQYVGSKNEMLDTSVLLNHWTPEEETISTAACVNMEWQQPEHTVAFPVQAVSNDNSSGTQSEFHGKMSTSGLRSLSRKARQRSKEVESHRRYMVTERLRALQELLPATLKVNQDSVQSNRESVLENAIGYIKRLELQLKDLGASRLGGEPISAPLFFLEGHGHYYPHDKLFKEPLEEVFGGLIEENPTAACRFLESKGLHMVPISSLDALGRGE